MPKIEVSEETYEKIKDQLSSDNIHQYESFSNYKLVRTVHSGVFSGILTGKNGNEVTLSNARRIYYWDGAATLSQLATDGTSKPDKCKFPCPVAHIALLDVIEIISVSNKAQESIRGVKVWSA